MIEIIPAIDLIDGKCVRLSKGDYNSSKNYHDDPLEMAKKFEASGIRRLHLVDLDGAKAGKIQQLNILESIAGNTGLKIDFSGGVRTDKDLENVFSSGAAIASIGSLAVRQPGTVLACLEKYGTDRFLLGADVRKDMLAVSGWQEQTNIPLQDFLQPFYDTGMRQVFCTDIETDGMLAGPATTLYQNLLKLFPGLSLIASGGVASLEDIYLLQEIGCTGVIIGKAIYEGAIKLTDLKPLL